MQARWHDKVLAGLWEGLAQSLSDHSEACGEQSSSLTTSLPAFTLLVLCVYIKKILKTGRRVTASLMKQYVSEMKREIAMGGPTVMQLTGFR
ncbi:hypothetical protein MHYP_G00332460 [Metynnis hypsauchen]